MKGLELSESSSAAWQYLQDAVSLVCRKGGKQEWGKKHIAGSSRGERASRKEQMHSCQVNEQRRMPNEHSSLGNLSRRTGGATSWLTGKLKPQQKNERDYCSGCFIKDPADSSGSHDFDKFTGFTEQSFKYGEALYYGLLDFIEDDLINSVRILSDLASIHRNFRAHKLPPGLRVNGHLSASSSGGFWPHWVVTPILLGCSKSCVSKSDLPLLGASIPDFLLSHQLSCETSLSSLRIQHTHLLNHSITFCLRENIVNASSKNPFKHVEGKEGIY